MKARRVVLTVEVETDLSLTRIKKARYLGLFIPHGGWGVGMSILQISANVIRETKKGRKR